jgi:hypothetical protein
MNSGPGLFKAAYDVINTEEMYPNEYERLFSYDGARYTIINKGPADELTSIKGDVYFVMPETGNKISGKVKYAYGENKAYYKDMRTGAGEWKELLTQSGGYHKKHRTNRRKTNRRRSTRRRTTRRRRTHK